jgi:hypothetical protein
MSFQGSAFFVGPRFIREGLVVHLDTANPKSYSGSGSVVSDISVEGLKRDATFTGTHTITQEGIYFDGLTGRGTFGQPSVTYASAGILQEWTIGLFIKTDNDSGWLISPASIGADHAMIYSIGNNGVITFFVSQTTDTGNRMYSSTAGTVPPNNKWTYVVFTLKGIELKIYINGVLNRSITNDLPIANWTGTWHIANRAFNFGQYFRGTLQNIHVYNRELTPEQILQNFTSLKGRYPNLRYINQI